MGDYFAHWLRLGSSADPAKLPKIYYVNWFRKNADGAYVWPGFGENLRVLKWIVERLDGKADGVASPIGVLPTRQALDTEGLNLPEEDLELLLTADREIWKHEAALIPEHLDRFGAHMPKALWEEYHKLVGRLLG
jgi:phosphoenolpyruvate carboxykinase (GTP)